MQPIKQCVFYVIMVRILPQPDYKNVFHVTSDPLPPFKELLHVKRVILEHLPMRLDCQHVMIVPLVLFNLRQARQPAHHVLQESIYRCPMKLLVLIVPVGTILHLMAAPHVFCAISEHSSLLKVSQFVLPVRLDIIKRHKDNLLVINVLPDITQIILVQ